MAVRRPTELRRSSRRRAVRAGEKAFLPAITCHGPQPGVVVVERQDLAVRVQRPAATRSADDTRQGASTGRMPRREPEELPLMPPLVCFCRRADVGKSVLVPVPAPHPDRRIHHRWMCARRIS